MCGICGLVSWTQPPEPGLVRTMSDLLAHRGPDAQGRWSDDRAVLGHRRLAIIDLHERSNQPMLSPSGRSVITFNGEIYEYAAVQARLAAAGTRFATPSDTEVLAALVEAEGPVNLGGLNGMFAFALWEREDARLTLVADRFGKKPLYYAWDARTKSLGFGSELKAILALPWVGREIDEASVASYLALGYVPAPATILRGVHKLEAGTYAVVDADGPRLHRYYEPGFAVKPADERQALDALGDALRAGVESRFVADVPVGLLLSGGVDSASIALAAADTGREDISAYTIGFDDAAYDETADAAHVAQTLGLRHVIRTLDSDAFLASADKIPSIFDEPFADSSALPTLLVSQTARKDVTVVLGGDGGDELFGGYNRHLGASLFGAYGRLPPPARRLLATAASRLAPQRGQSSVAGRLARGLVFGADADSPYKSYESHVTAPYFAGAMSDAQRERLRASWSAAPDDVARAQLADLRNYMQGDILVKVDRAAMATALEVRSPFLDPRVVALALSLPARLRVRRFQKKWLLRAHLRRRGLARSAGKRKQGFSVPLAAWFRGPLGARFEETVTSRDALAPRVIPKGLPDPADLLAAHRGGADHASRLWALLVLELTLRRLRGGPA